MQVVIGNTVENLADLKINPSFLDVNLQWCKNTDISASCLLYLCDHFMSARFYMTAFDCLY